MKQKDNDNWMGLGGQQPAALPAPPDPEKEAARKRREAEKNFQYDMTPEEMIAIREKNFGKLKVRPKEEAVNLADKSCPHGKPACINCLLEDEKRNA